MEESVIETLRKLPRLSDWIGEEELERLRAEEEAYRRSARRGLSRRALRNRQRLRYRGAE